MNFQPLKYLFVCLILLLVKPHNGDAQHNSTAHISGILIVDDTWISEIYLSHIPAFEDMYRMSSEMIIAKASIDSTGIFEFNLNFLPANNNLYRLHIVKKGNPAAMLIIGGKDENHLFFIANRFSDIGISSVLSYPPFRNVVFKNSPENESFQKINNLVFKTDSILSESGAAKRDLIKRNLENELYYIADTSNIFLVALYAIYNGNFQSNIASNISFYKAFLKKWKNNKNPYYKSFKQKIPVNTNPSKYMVLAIVFIVFLAVLFKYNRGNKKLKKLKKLSVQERNIFEMLQRGASNQEISEHFNIGVSTVKSHVSSIYSKLNIKSRKDAVSIKGL